MKKLPYQLVNTAFATTACLAACINIEHKETPEQAHQRRVDSAKIIEAIIRIGREYQPIDTNQKDSCDYYFGLKL